MSDYFNEALADLFVSEEPEFGRQLDEGLRAGIPAEELLQIVQRAAAGMPDSQMPNLVWCWLMTVDPDFRRRERERQYDRELYGCDL